MNKEIKEKFDKLSAMPKLDVASNTLILVAQTGSYISGEKAQVKTEENGTSQE